MSRYDCGNHKPCDCQSVVDNPAPAKGEPKEPGDVACLRCGEVVGMVFGVMLRPIGCYRCLSKDPR